MHLSFQHGKQVAENVKLMRERRNNLRNKICTS